MLVRLLVFSDVLPVGEQRMVEFIAASEVSLDQQSSTGLIVTALDGALSARPYQCGTAGSGGEAPPPPKPKPPVSSGLRLRAGTRWKTLKVLLKGVLFLPCGPLEALLLWFKIRVRVSQLEIPLPGIARVSGH